MKLSFEDQVKRMTEWFMDNYDDAKTSETIVREFLSALAQQAQPCPQCIANRYPATPNDMIPCTHQQAQPLTDEPWRMSYADVRRLACECGVSLRDCGEEDYAAGNPAFNSVFRFVEAAVKLGIVIPRDRMVQQAQPDPTCEKWDGDPSDGRSSICGLALRCPYHDS